MKLNENLKNFFYILKKKIVYPLSMLRSDAAQQLVSLLSNETDSLASILDQFDELFDFNDRILSLTACSLLILDGLLDHKQQFVAVWILYSEYDLATCSFPAISDSQSEKQDNIQITNHPYFSVFKSIFDCFSSKPNIFSPQTCLLVTCILAQENLDFISQEPICKIYSKNFNFPQPKIFWTEDSKVCERISPVLIAFNDDQSPNSMSANLNTNSNTSNFPYTVESNENNIIMSHNEVIIEILQDDTFFSNFEPILIRPVPDVSPIFQGEPEYVHTSENPPFLLDEGLMANSRQIAIELLKKAITKKLRSNEIDSLINHLKKDDGTLIDDAKIPNAKISSLIENNSEIAKYVIQNLIPKKPSVLKILACVEVSAASVDVVRHILTSVPEELTKDFTDNYIANSTKSILSIKDNPTMLRKARIFSKMIGFIVQNGYNLSSSSIFEMNSFCEEPKIRDLKEAKDINEILLTS